MYKQRSLGDLPQSWGRASQEKGGQEVEQGKEGIVMEDKGTALKKEQPWGHRSEVKAWFYFSEVPTPEEQLLASGTGWESQGGQVRWFSVREGFAPCPTRHSGAYTLNFICGRDC